MEFDEDIRSASGLEQVLRSGLEDEIRNHGRFDEIVRRSAALERVLRRIELVAPTGSMF